MEEEDHQEQQKHVCKLCNKSFPCGRSLGGHMRSHVMMLMNHHNSPEDEKAKSKKMKKKKQHLKKLSSVNKNGGNGGDTVFEEEEDGDDTQTNGYVLRENPKKTFRFADSINNKVCKECGKGFQSWKALCGHMKCHSDNKLCLEEQSSWTDDDDDDDQKHVMDSQSEIETAAILQPNRRRRSRRRRTKYMAAAACGSGAPAGAACGSGAAAAAATTSSSLSFAANNGGSSSVSEIEHEQQQEVAMCLMMLSRDTSHNWIATGGGGDGLNFAAESSDNEEISINGFLGDEEIKKDEAPPIGSKKMKMKKFQVSQNGFLRNEGIKNKFEDVELGKKKKKMNQEAKLGLIYKIDSSTSKKRVVPDSSELMEMMNSSKISNSGCEFNNNHIIKRSKFECNTCNKIFHSYQALGGHRASHKKTKGCCFASSSSSRIETSENSIETHDEVIIEKLERESNTPPPTTITSSSSSSKKGHHECPICFKVFSSGQALGGHKRSHLIGVVNGESKTDLHLHHHHHHHQSIVIQKPKQKVHRDFLDLNLPAPIEEESSCAIANVDDEFKPWWVVGNSSHSHKQYETLFGLISNS